MTCNATDLPMLPVTHSAHESQSAQIMDWPFDVRPLTPNLGARILDIDLAQGVDDAMFAAIYQAFLRYQVLLFGKQELPPSKQVEFTRHFGEVQIHVMNQYHADAYPELYRLSNVGADGRPNGHDPDKGTLVWHTDGSWRPLTGQATIIYGEIVPESGGETHFCDMYGALQRLSPQWKERIDGNHAVHNLDFSRTRRHGEEPMTGAQKRDTPPVGHPIVRTHPDPGDNVCSSVTTLNTSSACLMTKVERGSKN